jgi:YVTN family beta-propeller protein
MPENRKGSGLGWSLWAIVILLWAATAAGDQKLTDIALGAAPQSLAVNPVTNKIYVTSNNPISTNPGSVYVVDAVTYAVLTVVPVGISPGTGPNGIAVNSTTNKTYVADYGSNTVSVIDGANSVHSVTVGNEPLNIAVNETTNTIYVTNYGGNTVSAIDGATENVTTINTGVGPRWLAVNPVTNKVYVANQDGKVTVIDGASKTATSIPVSANLTLSQIAVNTTTNMVYVGNNTPFATGIVVIDGTTNAITTTVPSVVFNTASWGVAVNSVTNKIFVTNNNDGTVTVIDGVSNSAVVVAAPGEPKSIAINSAINRVYVANNGGSAITVIDGATNQTVTITVGSEPSSLGVIASLNRVFVASTGSNSVGVIDTSGALGNSAPTVSITSPANGSSVSQTVTVQANASPSSGLTLAGVQFKLDGVTLGAQVTSAPYAISWNTTQTTNGSHTITAVATDSAGTAASFSVTVTVSNSNTDFAWSVLTASPPVAAGATATYLLNLTSAATFSGTVSLTCSGAPATAVCSVLPVSSSISANSTVPVTVKVATVGPSASVAQPKGRHAPFTFALALLAPFALAGWRGSRRRKRIRQWVIGGFLALMMLLASCGGGGAVPPGASSVNTTKSTGTATGTYTLTITGTSAAITHTISLTLTVT